MLWASTTPPKPTQPTTPSPPLGAQPHRRAVLLIEDEEDVRDAGAAWLEEEGFDVVVAASGGEGIAVLQQQTPDVVVLDLMMPGVNGWDVWDWLQAMKLNVPVVVWTASGLKTGALGSAPIVQKGRVEELRDALVAVFGH